MNQQAQTTDRWKIILPLILGVLFVAPAIDEVMKIRMLLNSGHTAIGKVSAIDRVRRKAGGQPVVEFRTDEGRRVKKTFDDPLGGSYVIGEQVMVLYNPADPLVSKIISIYGLYSLTVLPLTLALVSLSAAVLFYLRSRTVGVKRQSGQILSVASIEKH